MNHNLSTTSKYNLFDIFTPFEEGTTDWQADNFAMYAPRHITKEGLPLLSGGEMLGTDQYYLEKRSGKF